MMKKIAFVIILVLMLTIGYVVTNKYIEQYSISPTKSDIERFIEDRSNMEVVVRDFVITNNKLHFIFTIGESGNVGSGELKRGLNNKYKFEFYGHGTNVIRQRIIETNKGQYLKLAGRNQQDIGHIQAYIEDEVYEVEIPNGEYYLIMTPVHKTKQEFVTGMIVYNRSGEEIYRISVPNENSAIQIENEMTIARSNLYPVNGTPNYLSLRLVEGTYSEDWTPGPYMGKNWRGQFQLVLSDEFGQELSRFDLSDHYDEKLVFNETFEFQFDDYNGDQLIDFTIGQYGTSNGNFYKLFTITQDHQVQLLDIEEGDEIFISGGDRYSMLLDKLDEKSFRTSHYNNAKGEYIETTYSWDGEKFINIDTDS